jgi:hypothetical protein
MPAKSKYNIETLEEFCSQNEVKLVHNYYTVNKNSKIEGYCKNANCQYIFSKTFCYLISSKNMYCKKCSCKNGIDKRRDTNLEKYGTTCNLKCQETKDKIKQTNLKKYGCEFISQSKIIKDKVKNTNIERYGSSYLFSNKDIDLKRKETMMKKYGCEHATQNKDIMNKIKDTNLQKYGCEYVTQSENIKLKIIQTNLDKYGVEHHFQNSEIFNKAESKLYKYKNYVTSKGKTFKCQGYEHFAIPYLINNEKINESDIFTERKDVPEIWYNDQTNKKHKHYVDIFIKSLNKCIEIKSNWTFNKNKEIVFLKQNAAKELGYIYEIWIYDQKGNCVEKHI